MIEGQYEKGRMTGFNRKIDLISRTCMIGYFKGDSPWGKILKYNENNQIIDEGLFKGNTIVKQLQITDFLTNMEP